MRATTDNKKPLLFLRGNISRQLKNNIPDDFAHLHITGYYAFYRIHVYMVEIVFPGKVQSSLDPYSCL